MQYRDVDGVLVIAKNKTALERAVNKLKCGVVVDGQSQRNYHGWVVNTYKFNNFYKSDVFDPSGKIVASYTRKSLADLKSIVYGYLKTVGVLS